MNDPLRDARYAPPLSHVEDVRQANNGLPGQQATRGRRFLAAMIDTAIACGVFGLLAAFTPFNVWANPDPSLWKPQVGNAVIGFVLFLILQGYLLLTRGQTIGKALFKLRIARPDGSAASVGRLLGLRYGLPWLLSSVGVFGMVYALADCLFIFRASRRCLHDQFADTVVLQD